MDKWRVVKKDNTYYVQRAFKFLWWTYWEYLDCYGEVTQLEWDRMNFDRRDYAIDAMLRCKEDEIESRKKKKVINLK